MPLKLRHTKEGTIPIWMPCEKLPDLSGATRIAIDTETKDDGIASRTGPGGSRGLGHILGISIATDNRICEYIPLRHPETDNWNVNEVRKWFNQQMQTNALKVFANCLYDLEWLKHEGFEVPQLSEVRDVQFIEPLIDVSQRRYSLEALGNKYLDKKWRKVKDHMEQCAEDYLGKFSGDVRAHLWRLPAIVGVAAYAQMDAVATLRVYEAQCPLIDSLKIGRVVDLEHRLVPLLIRMRFEGVRIDEKLLEQTHTLLVNKAAKAQKALNKAAGMEVSVTKSKDLAVLFDKVGLPIAKTQKGNPSFTGKVFDLLDHPIVEHIRAVRSSKKSIEFTTSIQDHLHYGRVYCQFHPLKKDEHGTVSGRFSSTDPNLQQQPGKNKPEMGQVVRRLFIPNEGCSWACNDYSQIEYRLITYYAARCGFKSGKLALQAYREDSTIDFHQWVADLTGLNRDFAKTINFGIAFGMGATKLALSLGVDKAEAKRILNEYFKHAPFVRQIMEKIMDKAERTGVVKTIMGRRTNFDLWESAKWGNPEDRVPLPKDEAIAAYGKVRRAFVHKAGNRVIQGSAADLMKMAMVLSYEAGIYDVLSPHLTVHDELDNSMPNTKAGKEAQKELVHIMKTALADDLDMPIEVDAEVGPNWWDVEKVA